MKNIVIATTKSWNLDLAKKLQTEMEQHGFKVYIISVPSELSLKFLQDIQPLFIFFPHWSWIISEDIFQAFECVVFHMTDLPFGRGGSPLQNLIVRHVYDSKISAIRVVKELDGGDVYLKKPISLRRGSAEEIFRALAEIVFGEMIPEILFKAPVPIPQQGEITFFKRRKPEESNIGTAHIATLTDVYDFIRMLDGEGYPQAFLQHNNLRISFAEAINKGNKVIARVEITLE